MVELTRRPVQSVQRDLQLSTFRRLCAIVPLIAIVLITEYGE